MQDQLNLSLRQFTRTLKNYFVTSWFMKLYEISLKGVNWKGHIVLQIILNKQYNF